MIMDFSMVQIGYWEVTRSMRSVWTVYSDFCVIESVVRFGD